MKERDESMESAPRGSWQACLRNGFGTAADRRNQVRFLLWMLAWMVAFTIAAQTLRGNLTGLGLEVSGRAAWVVAILPNVLAVGVFLSYLRYLRMADELTRHIQILGLAVGFGVWFFLSMSWKLLVFAGGKPLSSDWALLIPIIAMAFGQLYFSRRYS